MTVGDYERRLRENYVILSAGERREKISDEMAGMRVKADPALLETLVYLTEYPTAITGGFDAQFLELPEEVLVTVMRHHQKYFSVEDAEGKLAPRFVAVMNIDADPEGFVEPRQRARPARALQRRALLLGDRSEEDAGGPPAGPGARHLPGQAGTYLEKTERMIDAGERAGRGCARRAGRRFSPSAISPPNWSRNSPSCKAWWAGSMRARRASPSRSGRPSTTITSPRAWKTPSRAARWGGSWRWPTNSIRCAAVFAWD